MFMVMMMKTLMIIAMMIIIMKQRFSYQICQVKKS